MRNACRSSSPSSTLPRIASTRVTCAVRPAGTVRPGAHEANRRVLARRVLGQPRASAADGDDVTGEFGLVASRARFQVAKLLHALETVVPAEEGDNGTLSLNAQLLQHLWRDRLTQDHAVEPRSHPGGRAAAWRTGHEAERGKKSQRQHGIALNINMVSRYSVTLNIWEYRTIKNKRPCKRPCKHAIFTRYSDRSDRVYTGVSSSPDRPCICVWMWGAPMSCMRESCVGSYV
jgi:hypothetical protein